MTQGVEEKVKKRILVLTAVEAEREAVLRGLKDNKNFEVLLAGVGPVSAGINTTKVLMENKYDLVVSAGIGGGFGGKAEVGTLVVASEIIAADLGVETAEGFSSLDELGFGSTRVKVDIERAVQLSEAFRAAKLPVNMGPVLTVSTATGTASSTKELAKRIPGAAAEAMEGYGVALAAKEFGIPVVEIRTISNVVGPRDRAAWRIKEALELLEQASSVLEEVFK